MKQGLYKIGMLLVAAVVAGCGDKPETQEAKLFEREGKFIVVPEVSPLRTKLQVAEVERRTITEPLTIPGQIESDPAKLVKISSPVAGRIVALHKRLGDAVQVGDPLLSVESADVASAYSDYSKAQSALRTAELESKRQHELAEAEIAARRDVEAAEQALSNAHNDVSFAGARLRQLGLDPQKAPATGRTIIVRAPITGRVVEVTGAAGGYWNDPNQPVMTVADLSQVWFTANVQEKDLARVKSGENASIVLNAYPEDPFTGRVFSVGELLNPDTRTTTARIAVPNPEGRFRPAMFGRATFTAVHANALAVPKTALLQSAFDTRVYVEVAPWKFEPRVVKIGIQVGNEAEILEGLKAGERVVVKEGVTLND